MPQSFGKRQILQRIYQTAAIDLALHPIITRYTYTLNAWTVSDDEDYCGVCETVRVAEGDDLQRGDYTGEVGNSVIVNVSVADADYAQRFAELGRGGCYSVDVGADENISSVHGFQEQVFLCWDGRFCGT
jgi:hypothetical protein